MLLTSFRIILKCSAYNICLNLNIILFPRSFLLSPISCYSNIHISALSSGPWFAGESLTPFWPTERHLSTAQCSLTLLCSNDSICREQTFLLNFFIFFIIISHFISSFQGFTSIKVTPLTLIFITLLSYNTDIKSLYSSNVLLLYYRCTTTLLFWVWQVLK